MSIKKLIIKIKWFPSSVINKLILKVRKIQVGQSFQSYGILFIRGTGTIKIGKNVIINSCRETNPIGGDTKTIIFAKGNGQIILGDGCGISNSAIVALNSIEIGENVLIGASCKLYDHDFHSIRFKERMQSPDPGVKSAPIVIKRGAFIGAHSIILKGVTIGEESVVAAGSVVTKSIPDYEVWGGNPVKFIKKIK